jgi:hypothetical protein
VSERERPDDAELDALAAASPEERAEAQAFARRVDAMLEGHAAPPAMEAEERALLETATALHAALGEAPLSPTRAQSLLDEAFGEARNKARSTPTAAMRTARAVAPVPVPEGPVAPRRGRARLLAAAPWAVAAVAVAAALALWLRTDALAPKGDPGAARVRSTDAIVGPIPLAEAGDASARLDLIVADRTARKRGRP